MNAAVGLNNWRNLASVTVDGHDGPITSYVDAADFIMIQAMPTLNLALSSSVDFIFGAGYTHYIAAKGGGGHGAITLSAAFNFHKQAGVSKV